LSFFLLGTVLTEPVLFSSSIFAILFIYFFSLHLYFKLEKLTQKGVNVKQHIKGLKKFIRTAKHNEIKQRLRNDPCYLDKLLPYALFFGYHKRWLKWYVVLKQLSKI
jgi:hypothetical protein